MRTDRRGNRASDLNGPGAPPPPTMPSDPYVTVHGFVFGASGHVWDSRSMANVPRYVCSPIHGELVNHGAHWSCTLCQSGGTGDTAELAMAAAYRALNARVDRLTGVLNAIHERGGVTA